MAKIEQLKKDHEGEWLAIAYLNYDHGVPVEGELIVHSLDETQVWNAIRGDHRKIYVTYAGPLIDEDMAIAISPTIIWDEQK
jgi:hypothetical protein